MRWAYPVTAAETEWKLRGTVKATRKEGYGLETKTRENEAGFDPGLSKLIKRLSPCHKNFP